jgi:hypothetical protein
MNMIKFVMTPPLLYSAFWARGPAKCNEPDYSGTRSEQELCFSGERLSNIQGAILLPT